tara:strand:+ start:176 stop:517 length:342 start_codon:yes stop_codon:yes gene_type:complete
MCPQAIPIVMKFLPAITAVAGTVSALSNRGSDRERGKSQLLTPAPATRISRPGSSGLGDEDIKREDKPTETTLSAAQKAMAKRKSQGLKTKGAATYSGPSVQTPTQPTAGLNL